ncbi:MAG: tetratricopeptide repeat protein [Bacteroides sp.]|nr:tetratricopeptide repeat protein [Bacteroides sp.]
MKSKEHSDSTEQEELLISGIKKGFNAELKQQLRDEDQRMNRSIGIRRLRYLSGIAAVVMIGLISFIFINRISPDPLKLYAEYYQPYPNINKPLTRLEDKSDDPYFLYETGKYRDAITGFKTLLEANPDDEAALFYTGIIQMELQDFEQAAVQFEQLLAQQPGTYSRPALWYISLSYLQLEQTEKAIEFLRELADEEDLYSRNSGKILEKLL